MYTIFCVVVLEAGEGLGPRHETVVLITCLDPENRQQCPDVVALIAVVVRGFSLTVDLCLFFRFFELRLSRCFGGCAIIILFSHRFFPLLALVSDVRWSAAPTICRKKMVVNFAIYCFSTSLPVIAT